jgi:hypothetical protein
MMDDYSSEWRAYKQLRNQVVFGGIATLCLGTSFMLFPLGKHFAMVLATLVVSSLMFASAMITSIRVANWRCPRCGKPFVSKLQSKFAVFFCRRMHKLWAKKMGGQVKRQVDLALRRN